MATIDPHDAARIALIARVSEAIRVWGDADRAQKRAKEEVNAAEATKAAATETVEKCIATARELWDIDLRAEFDRHIQELHTVQTTETALEHVATEKPKPIREYVLQATQAAYPSPVRAATLRKQLADIGRPTHEKTVGMTLYRLLCDGFLRRKGWDWYFVPEADRWNGEPPTERESPADEAGLFEEAMD